MVWWWNALHTRVVGSRIIRPNGILGPPQSPNSAAISGQSLGHHSSICGVFPSRRRSQRRIIGTMHFPISRWIYSTCSIVQQSDRHIYGKKTLHTRQNTTPEVGLLLIAESENKSLYVVARNFWLASVPYVSKSILKSYVCTGATPSDADNSG